MEKSLKDLLLKDLCARLPYNVAIYCESNYTPQRIVDIDFDKSCIIVKPYNKELIGVGCVRLEDIKPYLRPMESMTEEEKKNFDLLCYNCQWQDSVDYNITELDRTQLIYVIDWLNARFFDYRGLIPIGLALPAPKGMYNK